MNGFEKLLEDVKEDGLNFEAVVNKKTGERYTLKELSAMFGMEAEEAAFAEWLDTFVDTHEDMEWI